MYQLFVILTGIVLLAGCASFRTLGTPEQSSAAPSIHESADHPSQPESGSKQEERKVQALFAQPYIDPLTRYLDRTGGDTNTTALRQRVQVERDRRCVEVAARYGDGPITEESLTSYRAGYEYSCPGEVAAYARRLAALTASDTQPPRATPDAESSEATPPKLSKQLNDCYLLTAIRNFSEAMKACRQPADQGDVKAQTNMALMTFALKDYASAFRWASAAAPNSAEAAHLLGQMYTTGRGVKVNADAADKWNALARDQGYDGTPAPNGSR